MKSIRGVSLDAFGTILELLPPAPALARQLRDDWGIQLRRGEVEQAFRAEITYYKAHHLDGRDDTSLAELRLRSARVLLEHLPSEAGARIDPESLVPVMMRSLRFRPYADVPEALVGLRTAGIGLAVVSNWDVSLPAVIERCGLGDLVDHVVSSAAVGAAKPDTAPFEKALELLGLPADAVVHVGDEAALDVVGAAATGIGQVLIRRGATPKSAGNPAVPVISSLSQLGPVLAG